MTARGYEHSFAEAILEQIKGFMVSKSDKPT